MQTLGPKLHKHQQQLMIDLPDLPPTESCLPHDRSTAMRCIDFDDFCDSRMLTIFSQACLRRDVVSHLCGLQLWVLIVCFGLSISMTHAADPVAFDRDAKPYLKILLQLPRR